MGSSWGKYFNISIFGESHGPCVGVVINGIPAGEQIDEAPIRKLLERRAPGRADITSSRREHDEFRIVSGVFNGRSTGAPLTALIDNLDQRSGDYESVRHIPRPGHADYTGGLRYGGFQDYRGGGHFSGRLTAPLCIAGGIAKQILARRGILTGAHLLSAGNAEDRRFSMAGVEEEIRALECSEVPVLDLSAWEKIRGEIEAAGADGDSVGGMVEAVAAGVPGGLGSPMFDGVENRVASLVFGIPGVKGLEFGSGMDAAGMRGSQHNDSFVPDGKGGITAGGNNHGGILGGITSGMPVVMRVAFKPTPSIKIIQKSVDLDTHKTVEISTAGRHDPCIALRAVPAVEAALAVAVLDLLVEPESVNNLSNIHK